LALKRSMSFMQEMDFTQQAAILGDEDLAADLPPPETIPVPMESAKKSKKQPAKDMKEVIRCLSLVLRMNMIIFVYLCKERHNGLRGQQRSPEHVMLCESRYTTPRRYSDAVALSFLLSQLPV